MPERVRGSLDWDSYAKSFGYRLRAVRRLQGFTQEKLGEAAGVSRNTVSNLERGTSNRKPYLADPGMSMIYRLAKALDVPPLVLMPDIDDSLPATCSEFGHRSKVEQRLAAELRRREA